MDEQTNTEPNNNSLDQNNADKYRETVMPADLTFNKPIQKETGLSKTESTGLESLEKKAELGAEQKTIRTLESDVVKNVKEGLTIEQIVTANANNTSGKLFEESYEDKQKRNRRKVYFMTATVAFGTFVTLTGIIFLVKNFAPGVKGSIPAPLTTIKTNFKIPNNPLIFTNSAKELPVKSLSKGAIENLITKEKDGYSGVLGSIEAIYLTKSSSTTTELLKPSELLQTVALNIPDQLIRSLSNEYLIGIHAFDGNQPLIILKTNSYENSYSAMLAWEKDMPNDLSVFRRNPQVSSQPEFLNQTTTTTPGKAGGILDITNNNDQTQEFKDMFIQNKDVRALIGMGNKIELLYSFIDRNTIVITNNENTFKEIVDRLQAA